MLLMLQLPLESFLLALWVGEENFGGSVMDSICNKRREAEDLVLQSTAVKCKEPAIWHTPQLWQGGLVLPSFTMEKMTR